MRATYSQGTFFCILLNWNCGLFFSQETVENFPRDMHGSTNIIRLKNHATLRSLTSHFVHLSGCFITSLHTFRVCTFSNNARTGLWLCIPSHHSNHEMQGAPALSLTTERTGPSQTALSPSIPPTKLACERVSTKISPAPFFNRSKDGMNSAIVTILIQFFSIGVVLKCRESAVFRAQTNFVESKYYR